MKLTKSDLHLHTKVSDGANTLREMLEAAREVGLETVSITDHDAVGAYFNFCGDAFSLARSLGLELISGIELDTFYLDKNNRETDTHLLGYCFDPADKKLGQYLKEVQKCRRQKVKEQIEAINRHFGMEAISPAEVFHAERDTLMTPHLVSELLGKGLVSGEYPEVQAWLKRNAPALTKVPSLPIEKGIEMIRNAGGRAVLAHPGFLEREKGIDLEEMLTELKARGLDGLEVEYPYLIAENTPFKTVQEAEGIIDRLRRLAQRFDLWPTPGSDAHNTVRIREFAELRKPADQSRSFPAGKEQ